MVRVDTQAQVPGQEVGRARWELAGLFSGTQRALKHSLSTQGSPQLSLGRAIKEGRFQRLPGSPAAKTPYFSMQGT